MSMRYPSTALLLEQSLYKLYESWSLAERCCSCKYRSSHLSPLIPSLDLVLFSLVKSLDWHCSWPFPEKKSQATSSGVAYRTLTESLEFILTCSGILTKKKNDWLIRDMWHFSGCEIYNIYRQKQSRKKYHIVLLPKSSPRGHTWLLHYLSKLSWMLPSELDRRLRLHSLQENAVK